MSTPRQRVHVLLANAWSSCHGGSSTSLIDIASHLNSARFQPLACCPEPGELPRRLEERGLAVILQRNTRLSKETLLAFAADVYAIHRLLRRRHIDLVHANVGCGRSALAFAARLAGIPYIQHVRNVSYDGNWIPFGYQTAARIVVNSDYVGKSLVADGRLRGKIVTIYNAVDLSRYDATDDRRAEIGAAQRPVIGFVGHLEPLKGVATLIRAFCRVHTAFPDALLVLVGCAPDAYKEYECECRQLVREAGLQRHVVFTGYRRDVPAWMRTWDVFVLPTLREAFGKVVIEAMAAGCPVVTTHVGGLPEIVSRPSLGSLVPPEDPEATATAILEYLTDQRKAKGVGQAAASHVRERFGLEKMIDQLERLYEAVIRDARDRRARRIDCDDTSRSTQGANGVRRLLCQSRKIDPSELRDIADGKTPVAS